MLSLIALACVLGSVAANNCPALPYDPEPMKYPAYQEIEWQGENWCYRVRAKLPQARQVELGCARNEVVVSTYQEIFGIRRDFAPTLKFAWVFADKCTYEGQDYYCYEGTTTPAKSQGAKGDLVAYEENKCLEFFWLRGKGEMIASGCGGSCPLVCKMVCPPREIKNEAGDCVCDNNLVRAPGSRAVYNEVTCQCPDPNMVLNAPEDSCECPGILELNENKDACVCPSPFIMNEAGDGCTCPDPFVVNAVGDACVCPLGFRPDGNTCVPTGSGDEKPPCTSDTLKTCIEACVGGGSNTGGNPTPAVGTGQQTAPAMPTPAVGTGQQTAPAMPTPA